MIQFLQFTFFSVHR